MGGHRLAAIGADDSPGTCSSPSWPADGGSSGGNFIAVEFPGREHATLTEHRQ
jgi:hypothetical protein